MTLHLELPVTVETALLARATAEGKDVSTFVAEVVSERLATSDVGKPSQFAVRSPQGLAERLQAWINLHPRTRQRVDDRRESNYAGRGE